MTWLDVIDVTAVRKPRDKILIYFQLNAIKNQHLSVFKSKTEPNPNPNPNPKPNPNPNPNPKLNPNLKFDNF